MGVESFQVLNIIAVVLVIVVSTIVVMSAGVEGRKKEEGDGRQKVKVNRRVAGGQAGLGPGRRRLVLPWLCVSTCWRRIDVSY